MEVYEANPKVNNVRDNGPEMMRAGVVSLPLKGHTLRLETG